jgi:hypothetical protein
MDRATDRQEADGEADRAPTSPIRFGELPIAHLSDEWCLDYHEQRLTPEEREWAERHLAICDECADQIERLELFADLATDPAWIRRMEARLQSVQAPIPPQQAVYKLPTGAGRRSLFPILRPMGAYGSDVQDASLAIDFPVIGDGEILKDLSGHVQRNGREYYAQIRIVDLQQPALADRQVVITVANGPDEPSCLQRTVDVGVTVLLGTDLMLSDQSTIEAHLLPDTSA